MCEGDEGLVVAPGFPENFVNEILRKGKAIFKGQLNPGRLILNQRDTMR